jgi:hypothetical protein
MSNWTTRAISSDVAPTIFWAARYDAVVTSDIVSSSLTLNDALPTTDLQRVLSIPPEWTLSENDWPPAASDPQTLALAKIKALLDFGAQIPDGSSSEIRSSIATALPGLASGAGQEIGATAIKQFTVKSIVRLADGQAEWEVTVPAAGAFPAGISDQNLDQGSPLKLFLQNVTRADVLAKMGG